jgi:hypothetical protein
VTRYIFTVTAGRSGQNSLANLLAKQVPNCFVAFEEPSVTPLFPGRLGQYERRFRRQFIETHELLGRGKVLQAFEDGDDAYLQQIADRRLCAIDSQIRHRNASIYIDVSKYFGRGLHQGFLGALPTFSLILLVRDPLKNMRSFLNRNKNFFLDRPQSPRNQLQINAPDLSAGELYLWAWCEMYLRFQALSQNPKIDKSAQLRTDQLTDADRIAAFFGELDLPHGPITLEPPMNTNVFQGLSETRVSAEDVACYKSFVRRIPPNILGRITYLRDYDPERALVAA